MAFSLLLAPLLVIPAQAGIQRLPIVYKGAGSRLPPGWLLSFFFRYCSRLWRFLSTVRPFPLLVRF